MSYTVKQLAHLSGTSVRALHHYDAIGLLKPASVEKNGYRLYGEHELLRLQQILFFRELDFSLDDIRRILERRTFDMRATLREHKRLLAVKKKRLEQLMETIEKTIKKLNKDILMEDKELYGGFSKEEAERYAEEARERWGHTDAYKESQIRVKRMGKAGLARVMKENGDLLLEIVATMPLGVKSEQTQRLIAKHYNHLRNFYEPNLVLYRGLAEGYVADPRFRAFYEKIAPGLAEFMRGAMREYCERKGMGNTGSAS